MGYIRCERIFLINLNFDDFKIDPNVWSFRIQFKEVNVVKE